MIRAFFVPSFQLRSEDVVRAYIDRIREVNPLINAVVEERFTTAIEEAKKADQMIANMQTIWLIKTYPLLGVPFTVKESCALKGEVYLEALINTAISVAW